MDGAVRLEPDEIRRDADHVGEFEKRAIGELDEAFGEDGLRLDDHLAVAVEVAGRESGDTPLGFLFVGVVFERAAIVEFDAVERIDRDEVDIVHGSASGGGEDLLDQERRGDDGGTGVEGESVLAVDIGAAAGLGAGFEQAYPIALCLEADGGARGRRSRYRLRRFLLASKWSSRSRSGAARWPKGGRTLPHTREAFHGGAIGTQEHTTPNSPAYARGVPPTRDAEVGLSAGQTLPHTREAFPGGRDGMNFPVRAVVPHPISDAEIAAEGGEEGVGLAEGDVDGGAVPAERAVIHARQGVDDRRRAIEEFDGGGAEA